MKYRKKICCVFLCIIAIFILVPASVLADEKVDVTKTASLTLEYCDQQTPLVGAEFELYKVADLTEDKNYIYTDAFLEFPVDLEGISNKNIHDYSLTFAAYVDYYDVSSHTSEVTDATGQLTFVNLEAGLYLVTGESHTQGGLVYTMEPFLVFLPVTNEDGSAWIYDVKASPKYSYLPVGEKTELKVLKVWKDNGNTEIRPKDVVVYLLKDGEIFDAVRLSSDNNWRFQWANLDGKYDWSIVEDVPEGYTVEIVRNGKTYTCTNTKPPEPPPPPPPDLPQTGQLWWPVPVLGIVGFVFIGIGFVRRRGGRDEA